MNIQFCYSVRCYKDRYVQHHTHDALELVYYVDGTGRSTVGKKTFDVRRNSFTITPNGICHDQENLTDMVSICVGLSQSGLEVYEGGWFDAGGGLGKILRALMQEMKTRQPGHDLICQGLLLEIAGLVHRIALENTAPPRKEALVDKAIAIIQHREGALSVAELADQLYVSKDYLRHLFHDFANQSPIQHIIHARIEKARDLLSRRDLSIQEIASQCGFESVYYFSRLFRKVTGFPPSNYRVKQHPNTVAHGGPHKC